MVTAIDPGLSGFCWDWSATTHASDENVVHDLVRAMRPTTVLPGKGLQGWDSSLVGFDEGGYRLGAVYFGGRPDDVHMVSTSSSADSVRLAVLDRHPRTADRTIARTPPGKPATVDRPARTSRVDTRLDTLVPFDRLAARCELLAGPRTVVTSWESRVGGESTGRTLYVGAPTSAVRVRVYEKWLESPGQYVDGTNRVEVQLRPPSRGKELVSAWSRAETFCASKLTRRLAEDLGAEVANPPTLEKHRGTPDLQATLAAMSKQYGPGVDRWLSRSGGDLDTVVDYLLRGRSA